MSRQGDCETTRVVSQSTFSFLVARAGSGARTPFVVIHVDMSRTSEPCGASDFEEWDGPQTDRLCRPLLYGPTDCLRTAPGRIDLFDRAQVSFPNRRILAVCECKEWDFECDLNFERNAEDKCFRTAGSQVPDTCRYGEKYSAPSGCVY